MKKLLFEQTCQGISEYLTLLWVKRACHLQINDRTLSAVKNDVILSSFGCAYHTDKDESLQVLSFPKEYFDSLFFTQISDCRIFYDFLSIHTGNKEHLFFHLARDKDSLFFLQQLFQEAMQKPDEHSSKMVHLLLIGTLTSMERSHTETLIIPNSTMISDNRFGKILKYIGDHYNTVTLKEVSNIFGYNPDYLSLRFQKITGVTFTEKLNSIRMEQARTILLSSECSIEEISSIVGFHDRSWFIRAFKKTYGMTPGAYRRQYRIET